ncbi:MAG: hypothetical protein CL693_16785 [Cellvibrionaceae bacterium]|nr:hypothetical protein [Cellvibrionaceae bacterium]|tara:strand:- start:12649 stop:14484 length:1836 start_codon:yes stop_codon:yes gene_type:complete
MHSNDLYRQQFIQQLQQCQQACQFIERGQAETPLADLFQRLETDLDQAPFTVTLLALTPAARAAALKWLYGQDFAVFSLEVSDQIGLLEVQLKDKGYSFEKSTGERVEFGAWNELIEAINSEGLLNATLKPDLRMDTQADKGLKSLRVLIPESSRSIQHSPALLTKILRESNVLVVAAPMHHQLDESDQQVIGDLLEDMQAFWPLLQVDELVDDINPPERGWWQLGQATVNLEPQLLTTHVEASLPDLLTHRDNATRQALSLLLAAKRSAAAVDALIERYEQQLRQFSSRKKREARKQESSQPLSTSSNPVLPLRTVIIEQFAELPKLLQAATRKRELLTATANIDLQQHIDTLAATDVEKVEGYQHYQLSLGGGYKSDLISFLQATLRSGLQQDMALVQRSLEGAAEHIRSETENLFGTALTLSSWQFDQRQLQDELYEALGVEMRYQGEMPKQSFFNRLGRGRQAMMGLMLAGMVMGSLVPEWRQLLMMLGLPLFLGGVLYSYISMPKEEFARMEKELTKIRDEVLTVARRQLADSNRHQQSQLNDALERLKKQWLQQLDDQSKHWQEQQHQQRQQHEYKARERLQAIEQQMADWKRWQQPIEQQGKKN